MSKAECGCKIEGYGPQERIVYCPLHAGAGALRDAAKAAQKLICPDHCGGGNRECYQLTEALRQAGEDV